MKLHNQLQKEQTWGRKLLLMVMIVFAAIVAFIITLTGETGKLWANKKNLKPAINEWILCLRLQYRRENVRFIGAYYALTGGREVV